MKSDLERIREYVPHESAKMQEYGELAIAVVMQAIYDWRTVCKYAKKHRGVIGLENEVKIIKLRKFFHSEWCRTLMMAAGPKRDEMVEVLEQELKEAQKEARGA